MSVLPTENMNDVPHSYNNTIDWKSILQRTAPRWYPKSVRAYLCTVVDRMNKHFAIAVSGSKIGSIQLTIDSSKPSRWLSTSRCRELFPHKISMVWEENGQKKQFHRSVFAMWLISGNRREIETAPAFKNANQPPNVVLRWLVHVLAIKDCPIKFNAYNCRKKVYQSWWDYVGMDRKLDYSPRRISQLIYNCFPHTRPAKGTRLKLKGRPVIDIPSKEFCTKLLNQCHVY